LVIDIYDFFARTPPEPISGRQKIFPRAMSKSRRPARHCIECERFALPTLERTVMNYTLLFYQSPAEFAARTDPEKRDAFWASFLPYMKALKDAGVVVAGAGLQPPETATTVRLRNAQRQVQDGPFADTKEQLGGFFIINVPDLDTALDWAARYPAGVGGAVEVRPNLPPMA
jgi:hypothetical protein